MSNINFMSTLKTLDFAFIIGKYLIILRSKFPSIGSVRVNNSSQLCCNFCVCTGAGGLQLLSILIMQRPPSTEKFLKEVETIPNSFFPTSILCPVLFCSAGKTENLTNLFN